MTMELSPNRCGDGVLVAPEECDDLNAAGGDGCSADCTLEPPPAADVCPGDSYTIELGTTYIEGTTINAEDQYDGSCGGFGGRDLVYTLTPAVNGALVIRLGINQSTQLPYCTENSQGHACWDRVLFARTNCSHPATEVACSDDSLDGSAVEQIVVPATAGQPVVVFVDGYGGSFYNNGPFDLEVTLN